MTAIQLPGGFFPPKAVAKFSDRLRGRVLAQDVVHPATSAPLFSAGRRGQSRGVRVAVFPILKLKVMQIWHVGARKHQHPLVLACFPKIGHRTLGFQ